MADYQLLGDTFGYHGYPANTGQSTSSQPGQPGLSLMPGSVGPGQSPYHTLQTAGSQPRPAYPQATDPLMSHKLHPNYAGYGSTPTAPSSTIRSQYSQSYMPPHGAMDSYPGLSMGQSHLATSGHSLSGSYGPPTPHQTAMMSQYTGQRLHSPSSLHSSVRHPAMPSQYSPYSSTQNSSSYHSGSSSELWSSGQTMSHLQQSPFSNFQSPTTPGTSNTPTSTLSSLHASRTSQFTNEYASSSTNPYFPNHMSNDPSSTYSASYPTGPATQPSQTSSSRSSSASRTQQQYSGQIGSYNSSTQSTGGSVATQPNQTTGASSAASAASNSAGSRFSHYSPYSQSLSYDPASQPRISPYPTPPTSSSQPTPNSPQYRSGNYQSGSTTTSQLPPPVNSPRRSATANSPAGSPMPPTSHTPGPTTVGTNSTQSSSQGSAFSVTNPSSSIHLTSASAAPSSLQQLEQMVMPHLGTGTSNTSATQSTSSSTNTNNFYSTNTNSSPISPQSQSTNKMFPHYSSSSSSATSSQFPYHQYQPPPPVPPPPQSGSWSSAAATGQLSTSNTHSLKTSSMMQQQPLVHSAQHLSTSSSNNTNASKTHSSSESTLVNTAYSPYNSSKSSNDLPAENNEYSQSYNSSNAHQSSSSSSNSSMSHSIAQNSYLNNSIPPTYENLSSQKQSSLKNDTSIYDHNKNSRSVIDSMAADVNSQQSQLSNSYHSMMQSYSNQPMSSYPNQSRFEQPHSMPSSQYGISSNSYNTDHDTSMIYDPYNIDNSLGIPPHQTMSEYRESQANLQQSGGGDYPQNDPYAANFDDYETTSKRKGKGRPKKDSSAPKKERKPRQPRTPTARGRGRGRGSKATMEQISLPGMMTDYDQPPVGYVTPTLPGAHNESMEMYSNNLDMYSSSTTLNTANKMPSSNPMLTTLSPSINSVLPQQPSINELVPPSTYVTKPPTPAASVQMNQNTNSHMTGSLPPPAPAALSRSPIPPQLPATTTPIMSVPNYDSMPESNAYTNYVNDTKVPVSDQPTIPNTTTSTVCDSKDLVSNESTKTMVSPFEETNFLVDSTSIKDDAANTTNNVNHTDNNTNNNAMNTESNMSHSPVTTPPLMEPVESIQVDSEKSSPILVSKSFNSSSPSSIEPNRSIQMNEPVSAPIIQPPPPPPQIYSPLPPTIQSSYDTVKEHCNNNEQINVDVDMEKTNYESSFNLNSTPGTFSSLNTMPNASIDLNNTISMNSTFTDESMMQNAGQIVTSTPVTDKPKKKRRSKKAAADDTTGETATSMDEKPKIKKKRSKKLKEQSLDDTTILSTDLDDKTQLSNSNLELSGLVPEAEPKPVKRNRSKKKSAKSEKLETNTTEGGETSATVADINGTETTTELPSEEKVKKPKVKNKLPKRKLPKLALKLKHNKKRRRGFGSPENSDLEKTPPPSPGPEDEAAIQKRRSARNTKRQRYNDDIDLDLSDEEFMQKSKSDDSQVMNVKLTEDTMVVEKILASRMAKRELELEPGEENNETKEPMFVEVEEYYVKYKNLSYLHCDWKTEDELEKGDRRINQKIRRYRQKKDINVFDFLDEEPFNPDYVEVDRILDVSEIEEIIEEPKVEIDIKCEEPDKKLIENEINDKNNEQIKTEEDDKKEILVGDKTEEPESNEKNEKEEEKMEIDEMEKLKDNKEENNVEGMDMDEDKNAINIDENKVKIDAEQVAENEIEKPSSDIEKDKITKTDIDATNKIDDNVKSEVKDGEMNVVANADDVKVEPVKKVKLVRHYLVKWRGLSYEESTWEMEDDIDDQAKIQQFWKFRNPPPKNEWKIKKKPKASEWQKLEYSPVYKNGNTLREYQLEGVNWLSFCWHNGQNCILADEMGLGKTIQSITFIQEMVRYGIPYPYLVIAPLSTIGNWQREFETWTDLNVVTYHGSSPSRNMLQDYELYYKNDRNERIPNVYKFQVMITTFEVILTDCLELSSIKWVACIIDEAHRLKNRNCKLLEGLRMLLIEHRVLLTGTPLQNNVEELYSLLHFLEPAQFTSNENFMAEFGDLKTEAQVDKLKAILKPMMLRRLKEDVEKSLAPKEETIIEVELTNVQKKYYRAILERNFQFLSKGGTYANMPNLMNTVMELRKCCIHPFLINGAEEQILQEFRTQHGDESTLNAIIQASGKLVLIDKLLPRLKDNGHRVLIFSQMVRCLDILEDYLCQKRYPYERIDGRVRGNLRQAAIDRFSKPDSDRFVFLLCTRAGGLGINLTAADTVIIFDSDWNPQNDLQAQARCHRIGQKKSVKVYRLICRNTYEREMFDRASLKLGLDKAVLQSINSQKNLTADNQMTKKEIEDLLRKGAYGALMEDDAAGDKFCEEDIDMILQRRTTKIVIESEGKGSTFSKASFATSDNRTDIEIDDPNFWEKWAKKANFDVDELKNRNELIVQEPRRRTQTKRFGADDAVLDISELDTSTDEEEAISMRTRGSKNRVSKKKRKGRFYDPEHDEDYAQEIGFGWTRSEFFKVEKGLLTFGWGRYEECLLLANFKRNLSKMDVEDISRVILLFALQNYKGDEKVKSFILDLITPPSERGDMDSNKLPQDDYKSRRSKKNKGVVTKTIGEELETLDWAKSEKYNPDIQIIDETYRKHLLRHANKILLRVRLLSYIKNDIIGDLHEKVFSSLPVRDIPLPYCQPDGDPPSSWWNEEADKSLIIGVYKHGYDRYNLMRQDPTLCFLSRCGPPDGAALLAEMTSEDYMVKMDDDEEPDTPATPATPQLEGKEDKSEKSKEGEPQKETKETEQNQLPFPTTSEMNNRLRRLVTCYQRNFKKEEARIAQKARHLQRLERLEKFEAAIRERENKKREQAQKKWSRREESDFYRVVSSFGIEYNKKTDTFDWTRFRMYAKLEKKLDETLTEYFKAFFAMCKKVVGRRLTEDEENLPISVDPITEERANRCLARIDLLNKVRDEILMHPELDERLKICQPQVDLPEWWVCGKHDKDLLLGASKYGLNRLDYNLMHDPDLSFIEIVRNFEAQLAAEEKLANERAAFELEIKTILNSVIDQIPDELEEKKVESEETVEDSKLTAESESNQDNNNNKTIESNTEKEETNELQSNEIKESISEVKDAKPMPSEGETLLMPITTTTTTQPRPQIKWPRDRVLQVRLENVCIAVEKNEWPTLHFKTINPIIPHSNTATITTAESSPRPSTPCSLSSASQEPTPHPTPDHTPRHETQSPFTGDYFYPNTNAPVLMNNFDDSNRKRRRRRRRFEMDNDSKNKLQSLLNSNSMDQHAVNTKINPPATISTPPNPNVSTNAANTSSLLFKNNKTTNSLLNNIPSQFLSPLLNNLQFNIRSSFRDDLLNDEKAASIFFGPQFAAALANVSKNSPAATATSTANAAKALGLDTKTNSGNNQTSGGGGGGPPPAHQSSSRNALALGSLDLTAKFKSAANPVLEKTTISPTRTNLPYPAHKPTSKNSPLKTDVLDLSSVPCKTTAGSSKTNSMANLLGQQFKKSNFPEQMNSSGSRPAMQGNSKKRSKIGSRIDALALNLQAKKMMEEKQDSTNAPTLPALAASNKALSQLTGHAGVSGTNLPKNPVNEKDLLAAFNSLSSQQHDKRQSFLEEFSKSQLLQPFKNNKNLGINVSQASSVLNPANILGSKKSAQNTNLNKVYSNMMESLKLYNKTAASTAQLDKNSSSNNDKSKPNLKSLLDENPDLISQSSAFLSFFNNPLFNQSLAQSAAAAAANSLLTSNSANNPTAPSTSSVMHNVEEKTKNTRSSKRTRSQFEATSTNNNNDDLLSKRPLLNTANMYQSLNMDPKKYLSSLLEKNNVEMKSIVKEKSPAQFKTPSVSSGTSSIRTRTSDKRAMAKSANASTSNSNTNNTNNSNNNSATNFANMNASNLLNNLSLAAAAASGGTSKQQQQQAVASSILANTYANAFNAAGKSNASTNFTNSFANLGFNNNIFPSMKLFLDAAAAAASAVSKGTSATSTSTPTCATATSATTTTTPALSSFANLFNMSNPLLNFSNFGNLANQTGNKKDGGIDFASLANSLASNSALSNLNASQNEDKGKSSKNSNSHSSKGNNSKNALNTNVPTSVNLLGSSSGLPFLYSNANFPLYNPLNFGLNNPFINNPNLMNGLANFSNVFTSTTNTATSSSNVTTKTKPVTNKGNSKGKSSNAAASMASGLLAGVHPTSAAAAAAALDSDDESLKSLMGNEDEENLNGEFDNETPEKIPKTSSRRNKSHKQSTITKETKTRKSSSTSK